MQLNEQVIAELFKILKQYNYAQLQYIPTRKSFFGIFKEGNNLFNFLYGKDHLMFYYSINPKVYLSRVFGKYPELDFFFNFCFLNKAFDKVSIVKYFGETWVSDAFENGLLIQSAQKLVLGFSVLPIMDYLIIRDVHDSYQFHEYDPKRPELRVHVGADSVKFVKYNQKFLSQHRFKNALELGCGTGIQLICLENLATKLTGVDINSRAVLFTALSAKLNGLENRLEVLHSDLYEKLDRKFDLILANPWFLDLAKGGLEEIPFIMEKLDHFLEDNGIFAIYFGSYFKNGIDQGKTALTKFAIEKGYDALFVQLGKTIEPQFLEQYRELKISHINSYYAILTKGGSGKIRTTNPGVVRQLRDEIYLPLQRLIVKFQRPK